ncbi:tungsten-dependent benzoyl-CoA reductase-related protein bamI [Geothermobacter ehrlichii]|uniref:Tungsten-dependent benzoyl-CoA reductase-related protein bamI n=1 Tax=Geothermobacter ehrlichii TaxID=213224 RepID=A0A5D3WLR4_9BACT|nr:2Fe-2S iron-sulfur cluster-binding protein [Geothermobacter ehrlichii]TYO99381.1 tungsten-dependent benzoyl-CoA reductase-related protein bamI [Geothermobacter ehrlichii]
MSDFFLQIDGKKVAAKPGMTLLEAAQTAGITIPTLCHHEQLEPYGACRICTVELEAQGRTGYVAACTHPAEADQVVRTRSEQLDRIRRVLLEQMLSHAPDSEELLELAGEYGADPGRYEKEASFCILCGLCVRYCAEVKQKHAVGFFDRGAKREINFIPEIAVKECWDCKECFPLCPTSALQAAYVLIESLMAPPQAESCGGCSGHG